MSRQGQELLEKAEREWPQFVWRPPAEGGGILGNPTVDGIATIDRDQALSAQRAREAAHAGRQRELELVATGHAIWRAKHPGVLAPSEGELIELALFARAKGDPRAEPRA